MAPPEILLTGLESPPKEIHPRTGKDTEMSCKVGGCMVFAGTAPLTAGQKNITPHASNLVGYHF